MWKTAKLFALEEVGDGLGHVILESLGEVAGDVFAGDDGEPGDGVVAAEVDELLAEVFGPVLGAGFVAVEEDVSEGFELGLGEILVDGVEDVLEVDLGGVSAELVAFEGVKTIGHGMGGFAGGGVAEAIDGPVAGGDGPGELALGAHVFGEVEDVFGLDV